MGTILVDAASAAAHAVDWEDVIIAVIKALF